MGKASSAKKVARASRAGGRAKGERKNVGFPVAIGLIVVLGIGLVAFARSNNPGGGPPELGSHWHAAYGVYVCDRWVQDLSDRGPDALGIHTHDDGLIHIHPFLAGASGSAATMGKFFEQVGIKVSDSAITLPPGEPFEERRFEAGTTTCGGEEADVRMAFWEDARSSDGEPDEVKTSGISGTHFDTDFAAYTIAFVPEGTEIPAPPSAASIVEGAAVDGGTAPEGEGDLTEEELRDLYGGGLDAGAGTELPTGGEEVPVGGEDVPVDDGGGEPAGDGASEPADEGGADEPASTEAPADGG